MKHKYIALIISAAILIIGSISFALASGRDSFSAKWGNYLNENSKAEDHFGDYHIVSDEYSQFNDGYVDKKGIYAVGKDLLITRADVNQAKTYYLLSDSSEEQALSTAINYTEKYETIWFKAISNGYEATDEEINARLRELKAIFVKTDSKEDIQEFINSFDSEEAFWEYEYNVYKKSIPIEKFRKDVLEKEFSESTAQIPGTEEYWQEWDKWFEDYQRDLVEQQAFNLADDMTSEELESELERFRY